MKLHLNNRRHIKIYNTAIKERKPTESPGQQLVGCSEFDQDILRAERMHIRQIAMTPNVSKPKNRIKDSESNYSSFRFQKLKTIEEYEKQKQDVQNYP